MSNFRQKHPVRLLPEEPFPPYTFIPGRTPHPISDPAGHSYGIVEPTPPAVDPNRWRESRAYLRGLDLFNWGFYWESHVELESLWIAAGRKGTVADFLKALIKLAAAGVKHLEGKPDGVRSHASRAAELLRCVAVSVTGDCFLGLPIVTLVELTDQVSLEGWPDRPVIVLSTRNGAERFPNQELDGELSGTI